jgi:hypothetical protein
MRRDIAYIPNSDVYGNRTDCCYKTPATFTSGAYNGFIRPDKPLTIGDASMNALDSAAARIRANATLGIVIYTIGLGNPATGEAPDETLMKRVSNDLGSPIYDSSKPLGLYVFAPDNSQLQMAFARIAGEILRISQ